MRSDIENRRPINIKNGSSFFIPLGFYNSKLDYLVDVPVFKYVYRDNVGHEYEVSRTKNIDYQGNQIFVYKNCFKKEGQLYAKFENYSLCDGRLSRDLYLGYEVEIDEGDAFIGNEMIFIRTEQSIINLI
jgi:hypothetical protein